MALLGTATTWARPGYSKPVDVQQPDGTTVTLLMHGDEFMSYMTTTDGYTVIKDADGYYRYAERQGNGLKATAFVAHNPKLRQAEEKTFLSGIKKNVHPEMSEAAKQWKAMASQMYSPNYEAMKNGTRRAANIWDNIDYDNFKGLVILVEWNDRKFTMDDPLAFFQRMTNEKNLVDNSLTHYPVPVTGSARDYFFANSMGKFDPTFDVVGPVEINYSCTYPCPKKEDGTDDEAFLTRFLNIIKTTMNKLNSSVDFTQYDLNNDRTIDMVFFIFAGYGSFVQGNNYKYIWPHASDMTSYSKYNNIRYDGKYFGRYACSTEIMDYESLANQHVYLDGVGTICHEFSHVLGLADHYDSNYAENGQSADPDAWDVMAGGADHNYGLTPVGYNAFERHILGFAEPQELDMAGSYQLEPFNTSNQCFLLKTGTKNDEFYIENRQQQGWDQYLPGHGMLVWRAETTNTNIWYNNMVNANANHMYFELLRAMPTKAMASAYTPFPGQGKVIDLTYETTPALKSWAGKEAVLDLFDITESDNGIISFNAGKDIYPTKVEDFESAALTTGNATDQQGTFCTWNLTNATIETVSNAMGNGSQVVKMLRTSTLQSSTIERPIRRISFKVWNGNQKVKLYLQYSTDGSNWNDIKIDGNQSSVELAKNTMNELMYYATLPAGAQFQIVAKSTSSSAVTYVDDIAVMFGDNSTEGITAVNPSTQTAAKAYNLSGQRVNSNYKGLMISNGKKLISK